MYGDERKWDLLGDFQIFHFKLTRYMPEIYHTVCIQQYIEGQFTAASVVPFNSSALSQAPSYSRLFLSVLV